MQVINYGPHMKTADAPVIRKLGVVSEHGEMTPVVFRGQLCLITTVSVGGKPAGAFTDSAEHKIISTFGAGRHYFSGYCENDVLYAFGTYVAEDGNGGNDAVFLFVSGDGLNWEEHKLFERQGWSFFNTSVCKGPDGYRMAIETARPGKDRWDAEAMAKDRIIGHPFTEFFLRSDDLLNWEWLPDDHCYTPERYIACPALRYSEGYYYMICLEELPLARYAPYIYRTRDFFTWEIGLHNPVLMFSREDRRPKEGRHFTAAELERITTYMNINDCDVDLCEFEGKTHIFYLTGDQLSYGCMCEAVYDGPIGEFFRAFFR
jgi:hypothetical protein